MTAQTAAGDAPGTARIGAQQAARLAVVAKSLGATAPAARRLLELLLRHTRGAFGIERSTSWLAREIGAGHSTTIRALDALEAAGLLGVIIRGSGRRVSQYRLDLVVIHAEYARLNTPTEPGETAVQSGEPLTPQGCQNDTPGVSKWHPRGVKMTPPSARGRGTCSYSLLPPSPPEPVTPPPSVEDSPAARGGGPSKSTIDKCPHGRTLAQGGCRTCGTTARDLASHRDAARRAAAAAALLASQQLRRAAEAEAAAAAAPMPANLRDIARRSRSSGVRR